MSKEIERRFFNFDRLEIERKLKEFNAVKKGIFFFKIIQYDRTAPIKRIRLRDEGYRVTFTIKEQTNDYDLENEVVVDNFKEMRTILKKIGLKEKFINEKVREIYDIGDCELIFDHYPGLPGYIEIEAPTEEKLFKLAKDFDLDLNEEHKDFSKMYIEIYKTEKDLQNITFDNVNEVVKPHVKENMDVYEKIIEGQKRLLEKTSDKVNK